jgi:enoyl-CoA hydratase/carnithine racemase
VTSTDTVQWSLQDAVATITLNRPRARNALTAEMKDGLLAALRRAAAEVAVRAVVLTGAGEAFCAGQDPKEHAEILGSAQAQTICPESTEAPADGSWARRSPAPCPRSTSISSAPRPPGLA